MVQMNLFEKQKERHIENNPMDTKVGRRDEMNWKIGIGVYTHIHTTLCKTDKMRTSCVAQRTQCSVGT